MPSDPKYRPMRWVYDLYNKEFITRAHEHPAPTPGIFDPPYACVPINIFWVSHILGALEVLTQPDSWSGDNDEKYRAEQEIEKIINRLSQPCEDDSMQFRQTDCLLEMSTNGIDWLPIFDSSVCAIPGPQGEQGEPGEQGAQGEQGEPGAPGEDGQDCECPDPNPPVGPETDDELCGIAEYIIEKMLALSQDVENAIEAGLAAFEFGEQFMDIANGGIIQALIITFNGIAEVTLAGYQAMLTVERIENFKCDMFCVLQETGMFDAATTFPAWIERNREREGGSVPGTLEVFYTVWEGMTTDWWNARAAIGASQPSEACDLCDCECPTYEYTIPATAWNSGDGHATGLMIAAGQTLIFSAAEDDTWDVGDGIQRNALGSGTFMQESYIDPEQPAGALLFRIGATGEWAGTGLSSSHTATETGELFFMCNDFPDDHANNSGEIDVTVEVCD